MTEFALAKLDQNPKGFFLAIEAGQIDWAAHANDAASLLHELIKIDQLVGYLLKSIEGRNDTLLIITADHATGLPGFAYSAYKIPQAKTIARKDGTKVAFSMRYNYGAPEILDKLYAQKTAFFRIAEKFKNLDPQEQNPKRLMQMVNSASAFKINIDQAKRVLATGQNPYLYPEHPDLSQTIVPKITDFPAFYPKPKGNLPVLIARELAEQQSFVWGTGTHSSTPTPVIAIGPRSITSQFKGIYTHVETGKFLRRALGK
jgi:alkaline phosphatase